MVSYMLPYCLLVIVYCLFTDNLHYNHIINRYATRANVYKSEMTEEI